MKPYDWSDSDVCGEAGENSCADTISSRDEQLRLEISTTSDQGLFSCIAELRLELQALHHTLGACSVAWLLCPTRAMLREEPTKTSFVLPVTPMSAPDY